MAMVSHAQEQVFVEIKTSLGSIILKLANETPHHRDNFRRLVKQKYFDRTEFNRAVPRFVIQGGDPDSILTTPSDTNVLKKERIMPEFHPALFHKRGALGMGSDDNSYKASFFTQFYIVTGRTWTDAQLDTLERTRLKGKKILPERRAVYKAIGGSPHLDDNYTVFGEVVRGMDVVDRISNLPTTKQILVEPVKMKLRLLKKKEVRKLVTNGG
jgi:peptidyl-prolyl cis-trans isomerase B (cyclophilin B)